VRKPRSRHNAASEHLNIEIMIKIEIDDVTVNNTSSTLSFLFSHLFCLSLLRLSFAFHQQLFGLEESMRKL
jgi:hypothetical protein